MPQFTAGKPESNDFTVEPGDYTLRVIEAKEDTSKGGNEMIKLKQRIIKKGGAEGPALFDYLVFTPSSRWKIDAFLKSCGQHPGDGETIDLEPDEMIGWESRATVTIESFDGKKSNKVAAYLFEDSF